MSYMMFLALKKWWIQQLKDINDFAASLKLQRTVTMDQLHISLYCCIVCVERWSKHLTNHSQDIQPWTVKSIIYLLYFLKRQKCRLVRSWCCHFWSSVITVWQMHKHLKWEWLCELHAVCAVARNWEEFYYYDPVINYKVPIFLCGLLSCIKMWVTRWIFHYY